MKRAIPLVAVAALLAGAAAGHFVTAGAGAPQPRPETAPTVGEFVLRYAQAMRLVDGGATADQALAALRSAGAVEPGPIDLAAALTEQDVVRIGTGLRLGLTTQSPERSFTRTQVDAFFAVFSPAIQKGRPGREDNAMLLAGRPQAVRRAGGDGGDDGDKGGADPTTKGKGKKKGLSPNDPD